jgi:hypothetical protein
MKLNLKLIALFVGLAVLLISSVVVVAEVLAAAEGVSLQAGSNQDADCGGLRMDEFYACKYGGWQPTPAAEDQEEVAAGEDCDGLRLDEYYPCEFGGWRPTEDAALLAK